MVMHWDLLWEHCLELSWGCCWGEHWDSRKVVGWELNLDSHWGWHLDP